MAMSDAGLATAIQNAIVAASVSAASPSELSAFCTAVGTAIVEYLKANAVVAGTVTSGTGAGGSVTGTIS